MHWCLPPPNSWSPLHVSWEFVGPCFSGKCIYLDFSSNLLKHSNLLTKMNKKICCMIVCLPKIIFNDKLKANFQPKTDQFWHHIGCDFSNFGRKSLLEGQIAPQHFYMRF